MIILHGLTRGTWISGDETANHIHFLTESIIVGISASALCADNFFPNSTAVHQQTHVIRQLLYSSTAQWDVSEEAEPCPYLMLNYRLCIVSTHKIGWNNISRYPLLKVLLFWLFIRTNENNYKGGKGFLCLPIPGRLWPVVSLSRRIGHWWDPAA